MSIECLRYRTSPISTVYLLTSRVSKLVKLLFLFAAPDLAPFCCASSKYLGELVCAADPIRF